MNCIKNMAGLFLALVLDLDLLLEERHSRRALHQA